MRILLVEDSKRLQRSIRLFLQRSGYAVDIAGDGEEGLWRAETVTYDVIILDLMLPKLDGQTILKSLRGRGIQTHVLILTARDTISDRVQGLQDGADDYLIKPFAFEELLARVQALIRRGYGQKDPTIRIGGLVIDTAARRVVLAGAILDLRPREYALLELLALRRGKVVGRSEIERCLYDERVEPMSNVVESAISALRRKLDASGMASMIQTRRGMGYCLAPPQ